jgi:two-component system response regulator YesN
LKVLVAEDEEDLREVLSLFLKKAKYDVMLAESGHEAMKDFDKWHPDLIITDIRMPDGDGFSLMEYISRVSYHFPPILVFSGYVGPDDEKLKQNPNFAGFLPKPIDWQTLIHTIKQIENTIPPQTTT